MDRAELSREQIVERLQRALEPRPEIAVAMLHGSFARRGPYRDIDLAVWLDRPSRDERFRYALDLAVHLRLEVGRPIDVRVLNDAPLAFRYRALQGRALVMRDEHFLDELRARTWDDYLDFQPFARQYLREALSE
jgi:uncharacterized protein